MGTFRDRSSEHNLEQTASIVAQLAPIARPLATDADLDPLMQRIGDARYVLLGEASHGTSEFYTWRARISQRLIREKGFAFIAVEGDWPDCYRVNRFVKHRSGAGASARDALHAFARWPTWMWANREVVELVEWLRSHNAGLADEQTVGFFGLDVYSLWDSMSEVIAYLDRVDPVASQRARRAYECFAPYAEQEHEYARATALVPTSCEEEVVRVLVALRRKAPIYQEDGREAFFDAEQNALIVQNAELYYRTMVRGGAASWNVRDSHMIETLERLMDFHGPRAKAIVWAHNTHIGDARFTGMVDDGEFNVGQIVRERHAHDGVVLVGFSTHRGTVIAAEEWGAPMRRLVVPPARSGSLDDVLHRIDRRSAMFVFSELRASPEILEPRGHRAIGVVYRPQFERFGNYVPTVTPRRYDALLFIDESRALSPLHMPERVEPEVPETYPTGL